MSDSSSVKEGVSETLGEAKDRGLENKRAYGVLSKLGLCFLPFFLPPPPTTLAPTLEKSLRARVLAKSILPPPPAPTFRQEKYKSQECLMRVHSAARIPTRATTATTHSVPPTSG